MKIIWTSLISIFLFIACQKGANKPEDTTPVPEPVVKTGFNFQATDSIAPVEVSFTNTSENALTYSWDFGDNTSSTEMSPKHVYTKSGEFQVKLKAIRNSKVDSTSKVITILKPILAHDSNVKSIPVGGNSWIISPVTTPESITVNGLTNWSAFTTICRTFMRVDQPGKLKLSFTMNVPGGKNKIKTSLLGQAVEIVTDTLGTKEYFIGEWTISKPGYISIDVQGITREGNFFGTLSNIKVSGTAITNGLSYVPNNNDNYFHWGRRGPSVHLGYTVPGDKDVEWYYSEVTVPKDNDIIGSYFMANGFNEGYFGMQVNSGTERRILFSIWSPYQTNDPNSIPAEYKITLIKKGTDVVTGEFGNEGAGGQSFLRYNWIAGNTYKFLTRAVPSTTDSSTTYTSYFFAPEQNNWRLIASFKRPKTTTYLNGFYSFLENFNPNHGNIKRSALYSNQWIRDKNGNWIEVNKATFTIDETGRKNYRKDYAGGVSPGTFFLQMGGFFDDYTTPDQVFTKSINNIPPSINFSTLP